MSRKQGEGPQNRNKEHLQQRIEELGPRFHNMRLRGIETAPHHFLGDCPEIKFRHFRELLPMDAAGMSVLDCCLT